MNSFLFIIKFSFSDAFICQAYTCKQAVDIAINVLKSYKENTNKIASAKIFRQNKLIATI